MKKMVFTIMAALIVMLFTGCQISLVQPAANPTAYIDKISPPSAAPGDKIIFEGHGTDPDGTIVAYRWHSSIDGDLSTDSKFDTKLSPGTHTISLKVQDNNGNWSPEAISSIAISGGAPPPAPAPTPTPTTPPPPAGAPVISSFMANPATISTVGSSTLSWSVSGASAVVINQGIGSVSTTGTRVVTPGATTNYTLTATGPGGSAVASTVVAVTAAPPPTVNKPDLVVTGITRDGTMIKYTILNQGTANAGPSNSRLFIDGAEKSTDGVAALAAGASRTESFSYSYACSGTSDLLVIQVDKDSLVDESNEANNSFSTTWICMIMKEPILDPGVIVTIFKPDLTVIDIWESGDRIYYRIKNNGTIASNPSTSKLIVSGSLQASDTTVPSIAAGASLDRQFSGYNFSCPFPLPKTVQVMVDTGGTNTESDEANNSRSESLTCF